MRRPDDFKKFSDALAHGWRCSTALPPPTCINMIAAGEQPIPIDLETILRASPCQEQKDGDTEGRAFAAATETIANSVAMVGLLPAYGRSPDNDVCAMGGLITNRRAQAKIVWDNINSDSMRPRRRKLLKPLQTFHISTAITPGLATLEFVRGLRFPTFLLRQSRDARGRALLTALAAFQFAKSYDPPVSPHAAPSSQRSPEHGRWLGFGPRKWTSSQGWRIGTKTPIRRGHCSRLNAPLSFN